jgi:hypothetical protein
MEPSDDTSEGLHGGLVNESDRNIASDDQRDPNRPECWFYVAIATPFVCMALAFLIVFRPGFSS